MSRSARRAAALPILCLAAATAGCGEGEPRAATMTPEQIHREIEAVHQARPKEQQSFRLSPLRVGDWDSASRPPACSFATAGGVLLLADQTRAVIRIGQNLLNLEAAGPIDPSGAFYRAGRTTISIGAPKTSRPDQHSLAASVAGQSLRTAGTWSCNGGG